MALPVQKTPQYKCELPVSGIEVKYRPFLVKEQANLLVTRESENTDEIFEAIIDLIKSVTNQKVDANNLAMADLEYLFLQIRARSIGETTQIPLMCQATEGCDGVHSETVDLTQVTVGSEELKDSKIQISDELIVEMQPPTARVAYQIQGKEEAEMIMPLMRHCLVRLFDSEEVYEMTDHRDSEIDEFVNSLTVSQFEKISEYLTSLPQLRQVIEWKCVKCGEENRAILSGLDNFF